MFGRATITLGIGPHSSYHYFKSTSTKLQAGILITKCNMVVLLLPHASKVLFLALSCLTFSFFVCASNISGTDEWICAKFTHGKRLVPRSDEFECQGQRSKVKVSRDKNALCTSITHRQRRNGTCWMQTTSCTSRRTIPTLPRVILAA